MRAFAVLASVLVLVAAPPCAAAQEPPDLGQLHPRRTLVLTDIAFLGTARPAVLLGGLHQVSLRPTRTEVDEDGFRDRVPPAWYLHVALGAGWSFERDPAGGAVARVGAGFVRRVDPTPVTAFGPVATATLGERTLGVAARVEVADNLGFQLGWVRRSRGSEDRLLFSLDALHCILADLGFWRGPCPGLP